MDEWYRASDAAEKLHVEKSTIYRWIRDGKIKSTFIRRMPNGMVAINGKGLIRPKPRKHRVPDKTMLPGDEVMDNG